MISLNVVSTLLFSLLSCSLASPTPPSILLSENTKYLKSAIYTQLGPQGDAVVRLLNATGTIGASAPTTTATTSRNNNGIGIGPLVSISTQNPNQSTYDSLPLQGAVVLVSARDAGDFLARYIDDPALQQREIAGVLIEYSNGNEWPGWNAAGTDPTGPGGVGWNWNPYGKNLLRQSFPFPIFQLDNATTRSARERAEYNAKNSYRPPVNVAKMELLMQGTHNSTYCIQQNTCYPLGGHSVWASLPPASTSTNDETQQQQSRQQQRVVLAVAQVDSTSLFHRLTQASNTPLSGLIALLTAAKILGSPLNTDTRTATYRRTIVFLAMTGEPWDYMGSKRLLWDMYNTNNNSNAFADSVEAIEAIIEVGHVGGPSRTPQNKYQLYLHANSSSNSSTTSKALQEFLARVSASTASNTTATPASPLLPSLPPTTTCSSFLRHASPTQPIPCVVIEEFDDTFLNKAFWSEYDTAIDVEAVAATASFLAQSLHILAQQEDTGDIGGPYTPLYALDAQEVVDSVQQLVDCLATPLMPSSSADSQEVKLGLGSCALSSWLIHPTSTGAYNSHYIGILRSIDAAEEARKSTPQQPSQDPAVYKDIERFIWNYLAFFAADNNTQSDQQNNTTAKACSSSGSNGGCDVGQVCAGKRSSSSKDGSTALCLNATVRYVPSYSVMLEWRCPDCDDGTKPTTNTNTNAAGWGEVNASQAASIREWEAAYRWPSPDPMWTESNWPDSTPYLELYLEESSAVEWVVLGVGVGVLGVAWGVAAALRFAYYKRLKQD